MAAIAGISKSFEQSPETLSAFAVCKNYTQIMVYGREHGNLLRQFNQLLALKGFPVKKVFDFSAGEPPPHAPLAHVTTLEQTQINQLVFDEGNIIQRTSRPSKTGITNLVLENYKRQIEGLPLIPLLFSYEVTGAKFPLTLETITSKVPEVNKRYAHKELRRMFKLCYDPLIDPKIRAIARKSFIFISIKGPAEGPYVMKVIPSPLEAAKLMQLWQERLKKKTAQLKPPELNWRIQLAHHVAQFDRQSSSLDSPPLLAVSPTFVSSSAKDSVTTVTSPAATLRAGTCLTPPPSTGSFAGRHSVTPRISLGAPTIQLSTERGQPSSTACAPRRITILPNALSPQTIVATQIPSPAATKSCPCFSC